MRETSRLGDVTEFVLDGTHGSPIRTEIGIPVLSAQNVTDGQLSYQTDRFTSLDEYHAFSRRVAIQPGDLLLKIVGTIGRAAIVDRVRPAVFQRSVSIIRPSNGRLESRYFLHVTQSAEFKRQLASATNGSTQGGVYLGKLKQIELHLPPLDEQRRLAAILDRADFLRHLRAKTIQRLVSLKQSTFVSMFGDPLSAPNNWPMKTLSSVCLAINDCPHTTPRWTDSGVTCLRTSNLTEGDWNWQDHRFVSEAEHHARSKRGYLEMGDIVLSREGTVGIAAIVPHGLTASMGQRLVQVRANPSAIEPNYLLQFLLGALSPSRITRVMVGSTSHHLNLKDLRALRVPVPPLGIQAEFAKRMHVVRETTSVSTRAQMDCELLFTSLQHRTFNGELTAKAAERELAEVG